MFKKNKTLFSSRQILYSHSRSDLKNIFAETSVQIFLFAMTPVSFAFGYLSYWGINSIPTTFESFAMMYRTSLRFIDYISPNLFILGIVIAIIFVPILYSKKIFITSKTNSNYPNKITLEFSVLMTVIIIILLFINYAIKEPALIIKLQKVFNILIPETIFFLLIFPMCLADVILILELPKISHIKMKIGFLSAIVIIQFLIFMLSISYTETLMKNYPFLPVELSTDEEPKYLIWETEDERFYFTCRNAGEINVFNKKSNHMHWYSSSSKSGAFCSGNTE